MRARWITGPYGHGAAFALDFAGVLKYFVAWRVQTYRASRGK